jgi:hypothetical protein
MSVGASIRLNDQGLLPEGIHVCTLDQVEETFGRFNASDKRPKLFRKLKEYCSELRLAEIADHLIVDGSFVTEKAEPSDIDLVVALRSNIEPDETWSPYKTNLIRRNQVRSKYGFDVFVAGVESSEYKKYVEFFYQTREHHSFKKGLVKVAL